MKLKRIIKETNNKADDLFFTPPPLPAKYQDNYADREFEMEFMGAVQHSIELNKEGLSVKGYSYTETNRIKNLVTAGFVVIKDNKAFLTSIGETWYKQYEKGRQPVNTLITMDAGSYNSSSGGNMG